MSGELILVRHSLPEIIRDAPAREWMLSEEGKVLAGKLAEALSPYQPERFFCSPEPKAAETAEIIARRFHRPVQVIEDLQEHKRSRVSYLSRSEFEAAVQEFFDQPDVLVFGNETANESYQRFSGAIFSALSGNKRPTTVIVSHGTVMSLFVSRLTGLPAFEIWSGLGLPCFYVLDLQSNKLLSQENIP